MYHSKDTFGEKVGNASLNLRSIYKTIIESDCFRTVFEPYFQYDLDYEGVITAMFVADIMRCAEKVQYPDTSVACFFLFLIHIDDSEGCDFVEWYKVNFETVNSYLSAIGDSTYSKDGNPFVFVVVDVLMNAECYDCVEKYYQSIYEIAYAMAYANGAVSRDKKKWLKVFDQYHDIIEERVSEQKTLGKDGNHNSVIINNTAESQISVLDNSATETCEKSYLDDEIENPIEVLNGLIGLYPVKSDITSLRNLIKMQKIRESKGMKTAKLSYHCVFTGNPGTGKTTVARILAGIYKELGLLKSGHLVETDRSGLVADYVGQTATKTNAIIDKALDGVLFIDEAYALAQGGDNDFGKEAISTLLKRMEDDRNRLVVILAGYNKEMGEFINSNSGLQSRFSRYIDFPDYEIDELVDIFNLFLKQNQYVIEDKAMEKVKELITEAFIKKDEKFGNARYVRNLFEAIITNQANRLSMLNDIDEHTLSLITAEDI